MKGICDRTMKLSEPLNKWILHYAGGLVLNHILAAGETLTFHQVRATTSRQKILPKLLNVITMSLGSIGDNKTLLGKRRNAFSLSYLSYVFQIVAFKSGP